MVSQAIFEIRALGGEKFKRELERWLRDEQQQGDLMVAEVFRCLGEDYLCSLPLPKGVHWPVVPKSRNFRFLFFLLSLVCNVFFVVIKHLGGAITSSPSSSSTSSSIGATSSFSSSSSTWATNQYLFSFFHFNLLFFLDFFLGSNNLFLLFFLDFFLDRSNNPVFVFAFSFPPPLLPRQEQQLLPSFWFRKRKLLHTCKDSILFWKFSLFAF